LHFPAGTERLPDATVQHLRAYAINTKELRLAAAIAVNCLQSEVQQIAEEAAPGVNLTVLHVPVWGAFVPALNTLLGEAQRRDFRYIMYQSLEVKCSIGVLRKMLDHHTSDTLVVGPVLDGHVFSEGVQPLNGRSSPWNTLALWSTRKLALTGFLSIADGLPRTAQLLNRQISGEADTGEGATAESTISSHGLWGDDRQTTQDALNDDGRFMGSDAWWSLAARQKSELAVEIPAGVEEVTAVALLQHLLGADRARAILVQLPPALVEWKASWGGDERRRQWHEYKMKSKVARPAAQVRQLFQQRRGFWRAPTSLMRSLLPVPVEPQSPGGPLAPGGGVDEAPELNFGVVMHFDQSIRPPPAVERLCLAAFALFSANFTAYFASAFRTINTDNASFERVCWVSLLIGGVYVPMPISLWLTRQVVSRLDHRAGLMMFVSFLLTSHIGIMWAQLTDWSGGRDHVFLLAARFLQGMGAGVLFQARFVLASLSTQDHHLDLQAKSFLATDLGLGFGALLPWMTCTLAGHTELPDDSPELLPSTALVALSVSLLLAIALLFPRRLHRLPSCVRFPEEERLGALRAGSDSPHSIDSIKWNNGVGYKDKVMLLTSGTARVLVQSAAVMLLALWMRDDGLSGHFMQTKGTAVLVMLPLPFQMIASHSAGSDSQWHWSRKAAIATLVALVCFICVTNLTSPWAEDSAGSAFRLVPIALETLALLVVLAIAAPVRVSQFYRLRDAEQSMVTLEWLKAYVGRLLGPAIGIALQLFVGHQTLLLFLCGVTGFVALTA
jgi:hypothetical protein